MPENTEICQSCLQKRDVADILIVGAGPNGLAVALAILEKARKGPHLNRLTMLENGQEQSASPDRDILRKSLEDTLRVINREAWELHIDFRYVRQEAVHIDPLGDEAHLLHLVHLVDGSVLYARNVVLALQNFPAARYGDLQSAPNFFAHPWPLEKLARIPRDAAVGVIGAHLSAISVARFLYEREHRGPIVFMSRSGRLPRVQGPPHTYARSHALHTLAREVEREREGGSAYGTLNDVASGLQTEIRTHAGVELIALERLEEGLGNLARLSEDIRQASADDVKWQDVLSAAQPLVERYWNCFNSEERERFRAKYSHVWDIHAHTMPLEDAKMLETLMARGQLQIIRDKTAASWGESFAVGLGGRRAYVDFLVEATGLEYDVNRVPSVLLSHMLAKGLVERDSSGGIKVGFEDLRISPGLYALGSLTRGTHCNVNSEDRIASHASRIVDSINGLPPGKSLQVALIVGGDLFSTVIMMGVVPKLLKMGHMPFIFLFDRPPPDLHSVPAKSRTYHFFEHMILPNIIMPHYRSSGGPATLALTDETADNEFGVLVQKIKDINDPKFVTMIHHQHIDVGFLIGYDGAIGKDLLEAASMLLLKIGMYPFYKSIEQAMKDGEDSFEYSLEYLGSSSKHASFAMEKHRNISGDECACSAVFDCHELAVDIALEATDKISRGMSFITAPTGLKTFSASKKDVSEGKLPLAQKSLVDAPSMMQRICAHFSTPETEHNLRSAIARELVNWYMQGGDM